MEETENCNEESEILCGDCRHELLTINHAARVGKFSSINEIFFIHNNFITQARKIVCKFESHWKGKIL